MTAVKLHDIRIKEIKPLLSPALLEHDLPVSLELADKIAEFRQEVASIVSGDDSRLLVVVGPCSIHDTKAALEYAGKLAGLREQLKDRLCIVMRVYFEKPRTTVGWKGLINDPQLDGSCDINAGLRIARKLLIDINSMGLPAATEFLDTITPQYIADLISWGAIGARTTESQVHRHLASGLSMPIGFKNGTNGDIDIAMNAILSAGAPHSFLSVTQSGLSAIVSTLGNPDCHVILRGGSSGPNYAAEQVAAVKQQLLFQHLRPHLMVDCSHGNSQKDYRKQVEVVDSICLQMQKTDHGILGVMIESHLNAGRQDLQQLGKLEYGKSITDACVDWSETVRLLMQLAAAVEV